MHHALIPIIYDGPPSTGVTHWVRDKIQPNVGPKTCFVHDFVRCTRDRLRTVFPDNNLLHQSFSDFRSKVKEGEGEGKEMVIFDGSPITLLAMEELVNGRLASKSIKAVQRNIGDILTRTQVVLLKPALRFLPPSNMRVFSPGDVYRYGGCLLSAYEKVLGYEPTVVEMTKSVYINPNFRHGHR